MVALLGRYIHELNTHSPFATMADDGPHLQLSGWTVVVNAEMNFNFCSHRVLSFAQDADAYRAHVCEESGHELAGRTEQNAPIGGASSDASPFRRLIVSQSSNRNCPGPRGKLAAGPSVPTEDINNLLKQCEWLTFCEHSRGHDRTIPLTRKGLRGSFKMV